jgi:hypothetical protein
MTFASENNGNDRDVLEDAFRTYPIVPAPREFSGRVMDTIHAATPKPAFRLSWIDYALTLFVTSMSGLALFFIQRFPINWVMLARFRMIVLWERSSHLPFTAYLIAGCALVILVLTCSSILFAHPRLRFTQGE